MGREVYRPGRTFARFRRPPVAKFPAMKLYTYYRSTAAFRVRIALNIKGVPYESISLHLRAGQHHTNEYRKINPQGLIPALDDDGVIVSQSLAIIEYLDEKFPEPALLPTAAADRAHVRSMALSVAADMHPLNNLRVLNFLRKPLGHDEDTVNETWYRQWIAWGFRGLEAQAKQFSGDGKHMFGTSVTMADVLIVPQMYNATRFHCDVTSYPTLRGICAHLESLPPFIKAAPEVQPDAEPPAA
jgi:maleylacetoacetate isomerase